MSRQRPGRPRSADGAGRQEASYERKSETFGFRLCVINHFKKHGSVTRTLGKFFRGYTGKQLETKRKTIYKWERARTRIEAKCATAAGAQQRHGRSLGTGTVLSSDAEQDIVLWIKALRDDGVPVSAQMLQS
jgi:hypothetical protein